MQERLKVNRNLNENRMSVCYTMLYETTNGKKFSSAINLPSSSVNMLDDGMMSTVLSRLKDEIKSEIRTWKQT